MSFKASIWVGRFDADFEDLPNPRETVGEESFTEILARFADRDTTGRIVPGRGGGCSPDGRKRVLGYIAREYVIFHRAGFIEMVFGGVEPRIHNFLTACNLLQNLARYVFESGKWFDNYHWIPANGPIRADYETDIVGLAFVYDPTLQAVETPHGHVDFIKAFGITQSELNGLLNKTSKCEEIIERHRKTNPLLITDLTRRDE